MLQTNLKKEGMQGSMMVKSTTEITDSDSRISLAPSASCLIPPHQQQPLHSARNCSPQPFTIRVNVGNVPARPECHLQPSSSQFYDLKAVNLKKMMDASVELKRALLLYRYLQKDEGKCKQTIFSCLQDLQAAFLNSLNGQPNQAVVEALLNEDQKVKSRSLFVPGQENTPVCFSISSKSFSEPLPDKQVEKLKEELEIYRRDSIEALQKMEAIFKMVATMKGRYEAEKKQRKMLSEAVVAYVKEADRIIEKITAKVQKEGKIPLVEQEIRQVLTKLKFQAYTTTAI